MIIYDIDGTVLNTLNMNMYLLIKLGYVKWVNVSSEGIEILDYILKH